MWNRNISCFIGCDSEYEPAKIVLFGAPFDSTTSFRPGTRFASAAVRQDSWGLEVYSPYQDRELPPDTVFDGGDLELPMGSAQKSLAMIREQAGQALADGKLPFMIGGEHLVTLGAVQAAAAVYKDLHILHFDAHTDLRQDYMGVELSHACVLRRCWEIVGDGRIWQYGIRSGEREEFLWARSGHTHLHPFDIEGLDEAMEALSGKPVYLTVDLDVLDPSFFPGTGTPEPGGVAFIPLMKALTDVCGRLHIVGCDVNELCPPCDTTGVSTAVACKLIREMLIALA